MVGHQQRLDIWVKMTVKRKKLSTFIPSHFLKKTVLFFILKSAIPKWLRFVWNVHFPKVNLKSRLKVLTLIFFGKIKVYSFLKSHSFSVGCWWTFFLFLSLFGVIKSFVIGYTILHFDGGPSLKSIIITLRVERKCFFSSAFNHFVNCISWKT